MSEYCDICKPKSSHTKLLVRAANVIPVMIVFVAIVDIVGETVHRTPGVMNEIPQTTKTKTQLDASYAPKIAKLPKKD